MKLSIITINRNNAKGLQKTMESVFMQTFTEFEYVVVDGLSTDNSIVTIKNFEKHLTQQQNNQILQSFRWISEPDTGVYQAMNKGIKMASGDYLLFLNSGDFLVDKRVIENVFGKEQIADILYGRCNVSDKGKVIWTSNPPLEISAIDLYEDGSSFTHE